MTTQPEPQKSGFCGFLNVLKPPGMSSAAVVGYVRRRLGGEKVGHAGTLDPEAAGVLPLMVGKAARLFDYMQDKEKGYIAEVAFGCSTDTQDAQGAALDYGDRYPDEQAIREALARFVGEGTQTPPMFSALKRDGQRLYQLARNGQSVALDARPVTVHSLELTRVTERHGAMLAIHCAKGFYVRTLCHDLGQALGCPAHMRFLLRTQSGAFTLDTAQTLEELATKPIALLPMDVALAHLPTAEIPDRLDKPFRNGVPLAASALATALPEAAPFRMTRNGRLAAIGEARGGQIRVRTWLGD